MNPLDLDLIAELAPEAVLLAGPLEDDLEIGNVLVARETAAYHVVGVVGQAVIAFGDDGLGLGGVRADPNLDENRFERSIVAFRCDRVQRQTSKFHILFQAYVDPVALALVAARLPVCVCAAVNQAYVFLDSFLDIKYLKRRFIEF